MNVREVQPAGPVKQIVAHPDLQPAFARRWAGITSCTASRCVLCRIPDRFWWFAPSIDRPHTLEGPVQLFDAIGGIPAVGRKDHMVQLGQSRGRASSSP